MRDIVVGVDGSEDCESALLWAASEAERTGARLVVAHAWEDRPWMAPYARPRRLVTGEPALTVLQRAVERARAAFPGLEVVGRLVHGRPEAVLRAEAHGAALLVLGSSAHRAGDGRLGSVLLACLRWPPCPVVVVGAGQRAGLEPVPAAAPAR
jgi:nucleotide-binding universal stress UspA family protein